MQVLSDELERVVNPENVRCPMLFHSLSHSEHLSRRIQGKYV